MSTTATLVQTHKVPVLDHLDMDFEVPVLTGLQRQGDVLIQPNRVSRQTRSAKIPVPANGVPVVRGEAGGNTHEIVANGPVFCDVLAPSDSSLTVAILTVPAGSTAYLAHPEHGYAGIGPGDYTITRQREQADELRLVND